VKKESSKEHWEKYWQELDDVEGTYSNEGRIVSELLREGRPEGKMILEVGAGSGRDSVGLSLAGGKVVVLDYVTESLEKIRAVASARNSELMYVCGDALESPFAGESFDIVFHQGLMEHFRDPAALLEENRRILKSGGILLVDVPQRYHPYTVLKHVLIAAGKWFAGWETEFSAGQLRKLLQVNGFEVNRLYGDWMVPGLLYRSVRYVLRRRGWARLPKYPSYGRFVDAALNRMRECIRSTSLALYTYAVIGAVARKR